MDRSRGKSGGTRLALKPQGHVCQPACLPDTLKPLLQEGRPVFKRMKNHRIVLPSAHGFLTLRLCILNMSSRLCVGLRTFPFLLTAGEPGWFGVPSPSASQRASLTRYISLRERPTAHQHGGSLLQGSWGLGARVRSCWHRALSPSHTQACPWQTVGVPQQAAAQCRAPLEGRQAPKSSHQTCVWGGIPRACAWHPSETGS